MTNEDTQDIDYRECDTVEFPWPKRSEGPGTASRTGQRHRAPAWATRAREGLSRAVLGVRGAAPRVLALWDRVWPPLLGVFLGASIATALWLLALMWWLNR